MKKLILSAMTFFAVMTGYAQSFAGGDGSEANPYLIATAEQMKSINTAATAGETTYFKMTADVDMSSVTDWVPFNQDSPYDKRVMFDGDGHTIRNFSYSSNGGYPSFAGVLYGEIKNVCFVNASVTNEAGCSHTGIVAGYLGTTGKAGVIENVMVTGTLTNNNSSVYSGGVAGNFRLGTLRNCYVDVTINTKSNSDIGQGGIVGYQYDGHNTHDMAHPICTTLENSYFCGSIETNGGVIGGIVGKGENRAGSITQNNINNSRSLRGYLRADQGHKTGYIMGSCPDDLVKVKQLVKNNYSAPGYIYDKDTKAEAVLTPDGYGQQGGSNFGIITSENLCTVARTLGWDTNVWDLTGDTPELKISIRPGSKSNPYLIATANDMKAIADKVAAGETVYFKMTADVDMAGVEDWVPFNAADPYNKRVVFDGDGHTISNFSSGNTSYSSFAGVVNGEIKNVAFVNANIQSTYNNCGVIGGYIGTRGGVSGVVENVMIQGAVTNASNNGAKVGGVCGDFASGVIRNCYVDVNVTSATSGDNGVGGIAGYQYDGKNLQDKTDVKNTTIENCYFVGSINASAASVGGILGKSENRYGNWVKGNIANAVSLNGTNADNSVGLVMGRCYSAYATNGCVLNNYSGQNTKAFTNGTAIERTEGQQGNSYNGTITTGNLCATAKTIGWDENVWNLDGSVPMLKAFPYTSTNLTLEATDGDAYYATFSAAEPVFFPNDVEVLAVTVDGNTLNMDKAFGGNYVPANTGVLLKTAGTAVTYYTDKKTIAPSTAENALIAGTGTTPDDASKKYYKLAYSDSSMTASTLGFYWGAENGAPFQTSVGKAYLVVGGSAAKAGFRFFGDETTGITTMTPQPTTHNQMYNLSGQRVNVNAKGIVIKNGKKFINK